jgi:hypothetical protein
MAAESKNSKKQATRSIPTLTANGSNVRAWETAVHGALQLQGKNCLLMADYCMSVEAHKTLALDLEMQVHRNIKASHAEVVAQARYVSAETAVAKSRKMKAEESLKAKSMPKLEPIEAEDIKEQVEVHVVSINTRQNKMLARAAVLAERMKARTLTTERRGAQHTVFYLDPLTALELDDEEDRDVVCHVYTLHDETMRYAVESIHDAQVRMMLDGLIEDSLSAIPPHITSRVKPGNIHDRFECVVLFFDDIGRKALLAGIDNDLGSISKRVRESFATFTSRFKDIEHRMKEQKMTIDAELMLSKLETAITGSTDDDVRSTLCQVKLAINLPTGTTDELLAAMAEPMRDREKDRKATQDKGVKAEQQRVNALYAQKGGGRGKGGKGGGGKGGKGGGRGAKGANKSNTGNCLYFAEGNCTRGNCTFKHVTMGTKEIDELKASIAARRTGGRGSSGGQRSSGGLTPTQVVNALQVNAQPGLNAPKKLSLAEKMDSLRSEGLSDEHIIKVASMLLEEK